MATQKSRNRVEAIPALVNLSPMVQCLPFLWSSSLLLLLLLPPLLWLLLR